MQPPRTIDAVKKYVVSSTRSMVLRALVAFVALPGAVGYLVPILVGRVRRWV